MQGIPFLPHQSFRSRTLKVSLAQHGVCRVLGTGARRRRWRCPALSLPPPHLPMSAPSRDERRLQRSRRRHSQKRLHARMVTWQVMAGSAPRSSSGGTPRICRDESGGTLGGYEISRGAIKLGGGGAGNAPPITMTVRGIMILETLDIFPLPCSSVSGELLPPSSLSVMLMLHSTKQTQSFLTRPCPQKQPPNRILCAGLQPDPSFFKLTTTKRPLGEDYISEE